MEYSIHYSLDCILLTETFSVSLVQYKDWKATESEGERWIDVLHCNVLHIISLYLTILKCVYNRTDISDLT